MERPGKGIAVALGALILASSALFGALLVAAPHASASGRGSVGAIGQPRSPHRLSPAQTLAPWRGKDGASGSSSQTDVLPPERMHPVPAAISSSGHPAGSGSLNRPSTQASANWSGAIDRHSNNFTHVSATWTVPKLVPSQTLKATATWVGIG